MGDVNQFEWLKTHQKLIRAPILELGSKNYGNVYFDYRALLKDSGDYLGTDLSAGTNVDVVADLTVKFSELPRELKEKKFSTMICLSVMEHVKDIYAFARNVAKLTAPGGLLFVSVPWVWRFHGYPLDYWRFSPEALKFLFKKFELQQDKSCVSYQQPGKFVDLTLGAIRSYADVKTKDVDGVTIKKQRLLYPSMINALFRKT